MGSYTVNDEDGDILFATLNDTNAFVVNRTSFSSASIGADTTFNIITNASLDFSVSKYHTHFVVSDGTVERSCKINIDIIDINEPPQLPSTIYPLQIYENSPYGTAIELSIGNAVWLNASDPEKDALEYSIVESCIYSLVENTSCAYSGSSIVGSDDSSNVMYFDVTSGGHGGSNTQRFQIFSTATLDYEAFQTVMVRVVATEVDTSERYNSSMWYNISIINVNDVAIHTITPASDLLTVGGETVTIRGSNFGFISGGDSVTVTYGPFGGEYLPTDCSVGFKSNTEITCVTTTGVGSKHRWIVTVNRFHHSVLSNATTSYRRPGVLSMHMASSTIDTAGGQHFRVNGRTWLSLTFISTVAL